MWAISQKQKQINNNIVSLYAIDLFIELIRVCPVDCVEHEISKYVCARQYIKLIIVRHACIDFFGMA